MIPKISIIVPIYNVEKYLRRCVNSILEQEFEEFELILVNDGSPDNCGEICNEYSLIDNRVKVIHKKNGGLSSARNAGLNIARGEFVGFVDSDDWINIKMYKILYELCIKYNCDISECCYKKTNKYVSVIEDDKEYDIKVLNNIEALEAMYKDEFYGSTVTWNKLYKKSLFHNISFPEGKLNEDQFTTHKLYYESKSIVCINRQLYYYYQSEQSIMRSKFSMKKLDAIEALEETRSFFKTKHLDDLVLWHDTLYSFILIKYYYILKNEGRQYDHIRKKIKHKYKKLSYEFLNNPNINKKSKALLFIFKVSPKLYSIIGGV